MPHRGVSNPGRNCPRAVRADLRILDAFQQTVRRRTLPLLPTNLTTLLGVRVAAGSARASMAIEQVIRFQFGDRARTDMDRGDARGRSHGLPTRPDRQIYLL